MYLQRKERKKKDGVLSIFCIAKLQHKSQESGGGGVRWFQFVIAFHLHCLSFLHLFGPYQYISFMIHSMHCIFDCRPCLAFVLFANIIHTLSSFLEKDISFYYCLLQLWSLKILEKFPHLITFWHQKWTKYTCFIDLEE